MRILVTDGIDPAAAQSLERAGHEVVEQFFHSEGLVEVLPGFDAVVVRSATKILATHLEKAKTGRLKLIIRAGVGTDNIDVQTARSLGVAVRNTPEASANAVAELAIAHMFSCARYLSVCGHSMRQGKWEKKACGMGFELTGRTLGILGFGRIGHRIGQLASGIGMKVAFYDPNPAPSCGYGESLDFHSLLSRADIICVSTPALPQPVITRQTIAEMKDGVMIINTSRGCNIDESALLEALNNQKVRAAGLDVWQDEPAFSKALCSHPAVSCTPHLGASTVQAQQRIGREIVAIINAFSG